MEKCFLGVSVLVCVTREDICAQNSQLNVNLGCFTLECQFSEHLLSIRNLSAMTPKSFQSPHEGMQQKKNLEEHFKIFFGFVFKPLIGLKLISELLQAPAGVLFLFFLLLF